MKKMRAGLATFLTFSALIGVTALTSPVVSADTVKLSTSQKIQLQYLVEEEKLARDVYTYLLATSGSQKFRNIASSEQTHMNLISGILKTYRISNPRIGEKPGVFKNATLANLYKKLIGSGKVDYAGAIAAGVTIEKLDIADLKNDIKAETASDVISVLNTLLQGSYNHLAAFTR